MVATGVPLLSHWYDSTRKKQGRVASTVPALKSLVWCCHTGAQGADQSRYLTQSPQTDAGPTSHSTIPTTPDGLVTRLPTGKSLIVQPRTEPKKNNQKTKKQKQKKKTTIKNTEEKRDSIPGSAADEADPLPAGPGRRYVSTSCAQMKGHWR